MMSMRAFFTFLICLFYFGKSWSYGFEFKETYIGKNKYLYQVYIPYGLDIKKSHPVILFLHGAGERGKDGLKQTGVGLGDAIREGHFDQSAIYVFPQCPKQMWWSDPLCEKLAIKSLNQTQSEFNVDSNRVYMTGISMGGYGAWYIASRYPHRFAAIAPIAGRLIPGGGHAIPKVSAMYGVKRSDIPSMLSKSLSNLPIWIVHGAKDEVVPVENSREIYKALKKSGSNVVYKELDDAYHNSWEKAYEDKSLVEWMFNQNKKTGR